MNTLQWPLKHGGETHDPAVRSVSDFAFQTLIQNVCAAYCDSRWSIEHKYVPTYLDVAHELSVELWKMSQRVFNGEEDL